MHEAYWYQSFGSTIVTIDPTTGDVMSSVELGEYGESEPVVDLVMHGARLLALVRNTEVVELVLRNPRRPRIDQRVSASQMGIRPHRFSVATGADGAEVYVAGRGGVVRWADQRVFLRGPETYSSVSSSRNGLVATHGKQVVTLANGEFVGSASALYEMPGADRLIFTRKARSGSLIGTMTPDVREVDAINGTRSIPGDVRAVRFFEGAGWVVGEDRILALEPDGSVRHWISVKGAMDVAPINENYLAIAGTFGRAVYRIQVDEHGNGDTFVQVTRMPARLVDARTDGRYILAGSDEGSWLYLIGSHADLVNQPIETDEVPRTAATDTAEAVISADGRELLLTYTDMEDGSITHREPGDAQMHSVVAVDGEFWVAHDRGLTVLYSSPMEIVDADGQVDPEPYVRAGSRWMDPCASFFL